MSSSNLRIVRDGKQFRGLFADIWAVTVSVNFGAIGANATATEVLSVPGVRLGDMCIGIALGVDDQGGNFYAHVDVSNEVHVHFHNKSGGSVDVATTDCKIIIARPTF